jgi:hypothetical protein
MKLPSIAEYRSALAQLILTKDQINSAATQLVSELDRAAQMLEKIAEEMDKDPAESASTEE